MMKRLLLAFALVTGAGCGGTAISRAKTVARLTQTHVDAAGSAWSEFYLGEQLRIVESATSFESGRQSLLEFRGATAPVRTTMVALRDAHKLLLDLISQAEQGKPGNIGELLERVVEIVNLYPQLQRLMTNFGILLPNLPSMPAFPELGGAP